MLPADNRPLLLRLLTPSNFALGLGLGLAACAASMTFQAGRILGGSEPGAQLTAAWAMCLTSICVAIGLHFVDEARDAGDAKSARNWRIIWCAMLCTEIFGSSMFMAGHMQANVDKAVAQNAVYEDGRGSVQDYSAQVKLWSDRLHELETKNSWVASTTADQLRAQLEAMEGDHVFARSKQCADVTLPESRKFCDLRAEIKGKISVVEDRQDDTKQLAATQSLLDKARHAAAETPQGNSIVSAGNDLIAKTMTLSLVPGKDAEEWAGIGKGWWMSAMFSIAAAWMLRKGLERFKLPRGASPAQSPPAAYQAPAPAPAPWLAPAANIAPAVAPQTTGGRDRHFMHLIGVNPAAPGVTMHRSEELAALPRAA